MADEKFVDLGRRRLVSTQTMNNTKRRFLQTQFAKTPKVTKIIEAQIKQSENRPRSAAFSAKSAASSDVASMKQALDDFRHKNEHRLKQLERKEQKLVDRMASNRGALDNARKSLVKSIGQSQAFTRLRGSSADRNQNIRNWLSGEGNEAKTGLTKFLIKSNTNMRKQSTAFFGVKWQKKAVSSTRKI